MLCIALQQSPRIFDPKRTSAIQVNIEKESDHVFRMLLSDLNPSFALLSDSVLTFSGFWLMNFDLQNSVAQEFLAYSHSEIANPLWVSDVMSSCDVLAWTLQ